jgi:membrane protease YdiL (CAAX protease family)
MTTMTRNTTEPEASRRPARTLVPFYAAVFAIAWVGWWPMAAASLGWLPVGLSWWAGVGAVSPAIVGLALAYREARGRGVRDVLGRLARWRVGAGWYAVTLLFRAGIGLVAIGLVALVGGAPFRLGETAPTAIIGLTLVLLPWNLAEEIGWSGFAYPRLRAALGPLAVGLVMGGIASVWHLPFWLAGLPTFPLILVLLPLSIVPTGVLAAWLLERTGGSVLIAALYHLATNVTLTTLALVPQDATGVPVYLVYTALLWMFTGGVVVRSGWLRPHTYPHDRRGPASPDPGLP